MWIEWIVTSYRDTLWPRGLCIAGHSDHVDNMNWYSETWWCVLTMWTVRIDATYPIHSDTEWIGTRICETLGHPHLETTHSDMWDTEWIGAWICGALRDDHVDHFKISWYTAGYMGQCEPMHHIVIHYGHMSNIWWYSLTTWAMDGETYWPCRQYELIQHIAIHTDHMGTK